MFHLEIDTNNAAFDRKEKSMLSLYDDMVAAGVPCNSHESDLYVPVNDTTRAILKAHDVTTQTTFIDRHDGKTMMFDIPFAFSPWWRKRGMVG